MINVILAGLEVRGAFIVNIDRGDLVADAVEFAAMFAGDLHDDIHAVGYGKHAGCLWLTSG